MRVLHIYKDYYPPVFGGMEKYIASLCSRLATRIHVEALVCSGELRSRRREVDGVTITEAGELGRILSSPISPAFPLCLIKSRFDILHYHLPNPWAVGSHWLVRPRGKVLVQYHSDIVRQARTLRVYEPMLRWFLDRADVILPTSRQYVETSPYLSVVADKCKVMPLGLELDAFEPNDTRTRAAEAVKERYGGRFILFVGVLRYYKGLQYLLEAMRSVECPLVIVGRGPEEERLKQMAVDMNLDGRVTFAGAVDDADKIAYLYGCEMLVMPSSERSEAFGLSMIEAMACGKPVVSTKLGTGVEFVNLDGTTGLNVPPKDPRALADAINRLLADEPLRRRLGEQARDRAWRTFRIEQNVETVLAVYERLLEK